MELHSIFMLVSIVSVIFFCTHLIKKRQKRLLIKIAEKQEPRFDLIEPKLSATDHYQTIEAEQFDSETTNDSVDLLLNDDPLLQPKQQKLTSQASSNSQSKTKSAVVEVLYLMLMAKPDKPYVGYELLQALLAAGLRFGAMNIFHRYEELNNQGKILFSVASASEPGTFEISKMGAYSGRGLMMFMRLSSNKDLMPAFEIMLDTAKQLVEDLGGELLDDDHQTLSNDKIATMKKKITEFEQKQLTGDLFDP